jgi:hypothetical protein
MWRKLVFIDRYLGIGGPIKGWSIPVRKTFLKKKKKPVPRRNFPYNFIDIDVTIIQEDETNNDHYGSQRSGPEFPNF